MTPSLLLEYAHVIATRCAAIVLPHDAAKNCAAIFANSEILGLMNAITGRDNEANCRRECCLI